MSIDWHDYWHEPSFWNGVLAVMEHVRDSRGELVYPMFEEVREKMGHLVDRDPEISNMPHSMEKLDLCYRLAVAALPSKADTAAMLDKAIKSRPQPRG